MWKKLISVLRLSVSVLPIIGPIVGSAAQARVVPVALEWEQVAQQDTAEAYTQYILDHPEGEHVTEALARIEMLGDAPLHLASVVRHRDLPDIPDDAVLGAPSAERLMNI